MRPLLALRLVRVPAHRRRAGARVEAPSSASSHQAVMRLSRGFPRDRVRLAGMGARPAGHARGEPAASGEVAGRLASDPSGEYTDPTAAPGARWGSWNVRRRRNVRETRAGGDAARFSRRRAEGGEMYERHGAEPAPRSGFPHAGVATLAAHGAPPSSSFPSFPASHQPVQARATVGVFPSHATLEVSRID